MKPNLQEGTCQKVTPDKSRNCTSFHDERSLRAELGEQKTHISKAAL